MYLDRVSAAVADSILLARDGRAVSQWEAALALQPDRSDRAVWPTGGLTGLSHWLAERLAAGVPDLALLSRHQTERLWQRVIDDSTSGAALISTAGVAAWARDARGALCDHGLAPREQGGGPWHADGQAFLDWNRSFERALESEGWIDGESLLYRLNRAPAERSTGPLVLLDPPPLLPEHERMLARWRDGGGETLNIRPDGHAARARSLIVTDPATEIEQVADWAEQRLSASPASRLAIVVGDLATRVDEVEGALTERIGSERVSHTLGRPISDIGIFGAAVSVLGLFAPGADFGLLSRWLRSPFFAAGGSDDPAARARLECSLRRDPRVQQDLVAAWRHYGLRARIAEELPELAAALDAVLAQLPRQATPTAWIEFWQATLRRLGWQGFDAELPEAQHAAWDRAWAGFAGLTAITGTLGAGAAVAEFTRVAAATTVPGPPALHGVHLFERIGDVGPAFAGAWVTGFSDAVWPAVPPANPLLPYAVRAAHGLPGTRPEPNLAAARTELGQLLERVPEAVFSCPERILDQPQVPNPVLADWTRAGSVERESRGRLAARIGARALEIAADPAPAFGGTRIPGGPRTLDLQSACPVRAFCDARLGTEALEPPARGIDPRLRGILLHRVVELLCAPSAGKAPAATVDSALTRAFAELIPAGDPVWQRQVEAERLRIAGVLEAFMALEAERGDFRTVAVERRVDIQLGRLQLRCRIDRIDRIDRVGDDEARLIIDYKTGQQAITGWFRERLLDCQLPLYAQHGDHSVGGIAVIMLGADKLAWRAAGPLATSLPGRQREIDADTWRAQLGRWREQLESLAGEFACGDVRIDLADPKAADGAYAALTRLREAGA